MINLIPHAQKKELERSYFLRVAALYILVGVFVALSGLILLMPSYITSVAKRQSAEMQVALLHSQKNTTKEELQGIISDINAKLAVFADPAHQFSFSRDVVLPVIAKQNSGISITTISYSSDIPASTTDGSSGTPVKAIIVSGIARDRASLLLFENNLKSNSSFTGVNVPISNFVSGSNINFNIQFQLVTP